jgi:hypothetical protein
MRMLHHQNLRRGLTAFALAPLLAILYVSPVTAQRGRCPIDGRRLDSGQWPEQAKCLLRPVGMYRALGPVLTTLPAPLDILVGRTNVVSKERLIRYVQENGIKEAMIGGPISEPITRARYFIIHDTSEPNFRRETFPYEMINGPEWNERKLDQLVSGKRTHVWVNRVGESATSRDFNLSTTKTGIKLESRYPALRGLFLHIELIQPRRCDPDKRVCCWKNARGEEKCNDGIAPVPGFTVEQMNRLALLYVVASTRRGQWLIPAFHGVVDDEFGVNAHDDPQHFDLALWVHHLQLLLNALNSS